MNRCSRGSKGTCAMLNKGFSPTLTLDSIFITSSCDRQSMWYNLYFTGKDISAQRIKRPTQGHPAWQWGCRVDLDPRLSRQQAQCKHLSGGWRGEGGQQGMGQVLMTSVEVGMGKAQTLTSPRSYNALLLFFNHLEPSRDIWPFKVIWPFFLWPRSRTA